MNFLKIISLNMERIIDICILSPFLIAQYFLYKKSYRKCAVMKMDYSTGEKDKFSFWVYCIVWLIIDVLNFWLVYFGKNKWLRFIVTGNVDIAIPIITTILISFFGLTAASYTFQINDLHEQQRQVPNDSSFIRDYLERTRFKFSVALWLTVLICALSVSIFMWENFLKETGITLYYKSECGFFLCTLSTELIMWMLYLNWVLFFHERYIDTYARRILKKVVNPASAEMNKLSDQLRRVNSLEMIFQRLLKNNVHVQDVYPLENRDLLAMLGYDGLEDTAKKEVTITLVTEYYKLINWRNAVIRLQKSRDLNQKVNMILGLDLLEKLKEIEIYIKRNRMSSERFSDMDLSAMDFFKESNLEASDFSNCDLRNINLESSNCTGANFSNVLMSQIRLDESSHMKGVRIDRATKLNKTNFYNSNLERSAIFYRKDRSKKDDYFGLEEANFDKAILTASEMWNVSFKFSSFDKAQLYYNAWGYCQATLATFYQAMLSNSKFIKTIFTRANLSGAVLVEAEIQDCCFEEARLHKADFSNSKIIGGNWIKVMATGAAFKNVKMLCASPKGELANYPNTLFCQAVLLDVDFTESHLTDVDMSDAQISECIFTGSSGSKNCFFNADMTNCQFNRTKWICCIFDYVQFDHSMFKNIDFSKGRFVGTSFDDCWFLNTENDEVNIPQIRREWERTMLKVSRARFNNSGMNQLESYFFRDSYLEKVSFLGVYGLTEQMFCGAIIRETDFTNTGITKLRLEKFAKKIENCTFDPI